MFCFVTLIKFIHHAQIIAYRQSFQSEFIHINVVMNYLEIHLLIFFLEHTVTSCV